MKPYIVTLHLMIDPCKNDNTFKRKYEDKAKDEKEAYSLAYNLHSNDVKEVRHKSIFSYDIKLK